MRRSLDTYRGQWLVLYFYPMDFTLGCTAEVCTYRDDSLASRKEDAQVLAGSLDNLKSHAAFAKRYQAPFPMLADSNYVVAEEYGVLSTMMSMQYAARATFIIAPMVVSPGSVPAPIPTPTPNRCWPSCPG